MKRKRISFQFSVEVDQPLRRGEAVAGPDTVVTRGAGRSEVCSKGPDPQATLGLPRGSSSNPFSLLITDDDDAFRETLRSIFEPEGFRTLLAVSGEEALDILREHQVHLALLDQNMPRLTGLETLRIIRQRNVRLPVILMTADNTQRLLREALSAQAFCVMSKPITRNVVVYTVHQALSRSYDLSQSR